MKDEKYYRYLYQLQRSGKTNMLGAGLYLENQFGLPRKEARFILLDWMANYEEIAKTLNIEV